MVGGALEGNAFRHFAYKQLRLPVPVLENGQYPRPAATIIDRGISYDGSIKSRGFANLPGMLRILDKYNISYEVFTDTQARDADGKLWHWSDPRFMLNAFALALYFQLEAKNFSEQAAVFGMNPLLIMAHGAGLSNAFSLPKR